MCLFQPDARYRRFLAAYPGFWADVGVFNDPAFLAALLAERNGLLLACRSSAAAPLSLAPPLGLASSPRPTRPRGHRSRSAELRVAWGFAPSFAEACL